MHRIRFRATTALLAASTLAAVAATGPLVGTPPTVPLRPSTAPSAALPPVTTITEVVEQLLESPATTPAPPAAPKPPTTTTTNPATSPTDTATEVIESVVAPKPSPSPSAQAEDEAEEPSELERLEAALRELFPTVDLGLLQLDPLGLGRVVIQYEDGQVPDGLLTQLTTLGVVRGIELPSIGAVAVTAPRIVLAQVLNDERITGFHQQRRIALDLYASRDQIEAEDADQPASYEASDDGKAITRTRPGVTGSGVVVAVLDSGINVLHPDVTNTTTGLQFSFGELLGVLGTDVWDAFAETAGPTALTDEIGHGTHVASTIGGTGQLAADTGGPDLSGIAPGVEFISMKITTAPAGIVEDLDFEESALAAFDYILRHPELGVDVANNSWGLLPTEPNCLGTGCFGLGEDTDFDAAAAMADAVVASGVDVIFSAGNDGLNDDGTTSMGGHVGTNTITVAAACKLVDSGCAEGEDITYFSSRGNSDGTGRQVDIAAPGDQIMAALSPGSILTPLTECLTAQHPGYYCISGTSMASPHVAGVAALMREVNPAITTTQVKACIMGTASGLTNGLGLSASEVQRDGGAGLVNTELAMQCAHALTAPPPVSTASAPEPAGAPLALTGGGAALAGLALLGAARALRGRRDEDEPAPADAGADAVR